MMVSPFSSVMLRLLRWYGGQRPLGDDIPSSLYVSIGWRFDDECLVVISMQPSRDWCCNPNAKQRLIWMSCWNCGVSVKIPMMDSSSRFSRRPQYLRRDIKFFFLGFRGTNLSTSLFCIHKMEHKAFRFVQHVPILYDALGTVYRYTAIIFKTFRSEICRFGKVFHYLSTQFIYVWKKMNRVGVRVCCGNDRYALWMKATLPIPTYIHSSLTNIHNDVLSQLLPYPNIELFLESSSLTIQISDVEAFFKYFKNRTNYFTDDIFFYYHHYFLKCVLPFRLLISSFYRR